MSGNQRKGDQGMKNGEEEEIVAGDEVPGVAVGLHQQAQGEGEEIEVAQGARADVGQEANEGESDEGPLENPGAGAVGHVAGIQDFIAFPYATFALENAAKMQRQHQRATSSAACARSVAVDSPAGITTGFTTGPTGPEEIRQPQLMNMEQQQQFQLQWQYLLHLGQLQELNQNQLMTEDLQQQFQERGQYLLHLIQLQQINPAQLLPQQPLHEQHQVEQNPHQQDLSPQQEMLPELTDESEEEKRGS